MTHRLTYLLLLLLRVYSASAQNAAHQRFFDNQMSSVNDWLKTNQIRDSLLRAHNVVMTKNKITLGMTLKDKKNWELLNRKNIEINHESFAKSLFDKFLFLCDLNPDGLEIRIDGTDVKIFIKSVNGLVSQEILDKMGEISDNQIIKIGDIGHLITIKSDSIYVKVPKIKGKLINYFKNYFQTYHAKFATYKFEVISQLGDELIIDVSNVVNVVLNEGYFEHIRLSVNINQIKGGIKISDKILAKYGAGIVWAPKSSDYTDMDPKYLGSLQDFNLKIKNAIHDALIN